MPRARLGQLLPLTCRKRSFCLRKVPWPSANLRYPHCTDASESSIRARISSMPPVPQPRITRGGSTACTADATKDGTAGARLVPLATLNLESLRARPTPESRRSTSGSGFVKRSSTPPLLFLTNSSRTDASSFAVFASTSSRAAVAAAAGNSAFVTSASSPSNTRLGGSAPTLAGDGGGESAGVLGSERKLEADKQRLDSDCPCEQQQTPARKTMSQMSCSHTTAARAALTSCVCSGSGSRCELFLRNSQASCRPSSNCCSATASNPVSTACSAECSVGASVSLSSVLNRCATQVDCNSRTGPWSTGCPCPSSQALSSCCSADCQWRW
mmetsp:Transcript_104257/g.311341  ORF Transcript_104257/g.311341 Transcript_104257/m.311341 type:complete len:328 (-) Transcript_104257:339-1322(-)